MVFSWSRAARHGSGTLAAILAASFALGAVAPAASAERATIPNCILRSEIIDDLGPFFAQDVVRIYTRIIDGCGYVKGYEVLVDPNPTQCGFFCDWLWTGSVFFNDVPNPPL